MAWVNGLEDVVMAHTEISDIDGETGQLWYRGMPVEELVSQASYEDAAHLLWTGALPSEAEHKQLMGAFRADRKLPRQVLSVIDHLPPQTSAMDALAAGLLSLESAGESAEANGLAVSIRYVAAAPIIMLRHWANQQGKPPIDPDADLGQAANLLYMLHGGQRPADESVKALEAYLILTMEHSLNASTFAGRVCASTRAEMARALVASLMTMTGPLHGGAPSKVMDMFDTIERPERAEAWLAEQLAQGKRLMGFGHRVYRTVDPRAKALRKIAVNTLQSHDSLELAVTVEAKAHELLALHKPGRRLYANVEYWAACVLQTSGIPRKLFTATFSTSRMVGWTAHIMEQYACDKLIRPKAIYVKGASM